VHRAHQPSVSECRGVGGFRRSPDGAEEDVIDNIRKVISGGQTGVDRAALDAALALSIPIGGWCPRGRRAEDGPIPARYGLVETPSDGYLQRTEWNVRDANATLIVGRGELTGGTLRTVRFARKWAKPCLVLDLAAAPSLESASEWLAEGEYRVLNVAGPRESTQPGIHAASEPVLRRLLAGQR